MSTPQSAVDAVASPCNSVCRMDAKNGLCEGCLRTIDEIIAWSTMSDDEKRDVWEALGGRGVDASPSELPIRSASERK